MKESYPKLIAPAKGIPTIPSKINDKLPEVIKKIAQIHFEGNVIPHEWFRHIKLPSGKPDTIGIILLAEIVYWYRPIVTIDEETGQQVIQRKKFKGDMFQSSLSYYEGKFGLTKDQVRQAFKRLEVGGFIRREYRDVVQQGVKFTRVTFVEPVPERIWEITHPEPEAEVQQPTSSDELEGSPCPSQGAVPIPQGAVPIPLYVDLLDTTTETYKDLSKTTTTTTTPVSAQTEGDNSSGSSDELIFDLNLASFDQADRERIRKLLEGLDSITAQQVLDEFNEALGCKCIKKSKWAWLRAVAKTARDGTFQPTADLNKYRRKQHQTVVVQPPVRKPSQVWNELREELLHDGITPMDYHTYIAPLRGQEDREVLWLEAPNGVVMDWVLAHLSQIEQTLKPHLSLPIRVCIG